MAESAFPESAAGVVSTIGDPNIQIWYVRLLLFALSAMLALAVEVGYAQVVPKLPQLYAVLLRAAVWDCVLVGIFAAQVIDLSGVPILAAADGGHYLPVVVLLYHFMKMAVCAGFDSITRGGLGRARTLHRSSVSRRVLLEFAGGATGSRLFLGRACFVLSGGSMWLALNALSWISGTTYFTGFIVVHLVAYCAAGLAALEPRQTLPGQLVQWLCTGWGSSGGFFQGPLKILGALFMLPFGASVIAAQIWLRTLAFIVWLAASYPCCRLQRTDNVYDAFEREMAIPLLQCSYLAYACVLAAGILGAGTFTGPQGSIVCAAAVYYVGMLILWTSPAVLRATVGAEEALDSAAAFGEDGQSQLLPSDRGGIANEVELEDLRCTCEELRALLHRERHNHTVDMEQKDAKLKDQELRARAAERRLLDAQHEGEVARKSAAKLQTALHRMEARCNRLCQQLGSDAVEPSEAGVRSLVQSAGSEPPPPPETSEDEKPAAATLAHSAEGEEVVTSRPPSQAGDLRHVDAQPVGMDPGGPCSVPCSGSHGRPPNVQRRPSHVPPLRLPGDGLHAGTATAVTAASSYPDPDSPKGASADAPADPDTHEGGGGDGGEDADAQSIRTAASSSVNAGHAEAEAGAAVRACESIGASNSSESEASDDSEEEHSISMADDEEPSRLLLLPPGESQHHGS